MNVFEVAIRKFVSLFGVLRVAIVNSQMPFRILTKAMLPDKIILNLGRRSVFGPGTFSVKHHLPLIDKFFGVGQSGMV